MFDLPPFKVEKATLCFFFALLLLYGCALYSHSINIRLGCSYLAYFDYRESSTLSSLLCHRQSLIFLLFFLPAGYLYTLVESKSFWALLYPFLYATKTCYFAGHLEKPCGLAAPRSQGFKPCQPTAGGCLKHIHMSFALFCCL